MARHSTIISLGIIVSLLVSGVILVLAFLEIYEGLKTRDESKEPPAFNKSVQEPWIVGIKRQIEELQKTMEQDSGKENYNPRYDRLNLAWLLKESGDLRAGEKLLYEHWISQKEQHQDPILMMHLSDIYYNQARYEKAKDFHKRAVELSLRFPLSEVENTPAAIAGLLEHHKSGFLVIGYRNRIGLILLEQGSYTEAQALLMDTFEILKTYFDGVVGFRKDLWQESFAKRGLRNDPNTPQLVRLLFLLGSLNSTVSRFADAEAILLQGLELQSDIATYLDFNWKLSEVYRIQGRYPEGESLINSRLRLAEQQCGQYHPWYVFALTDLASVTHEQGLYREAENDFDRAISLGEIAMGNEHYLLAPLLISTSKLYQDQGRLDEAETLLDRALSKQIKAFDSEHPVICETLRNLSIVYRSQGRYDDSEKALILAIGILARKFGQNSPNIALYLNELGALKCRLGRLNEAEKVMGRAISLLVESSLTETIKMAECLQTISEIRIAQNNLLEAKSLLSRKLEIQKKLLVATHKKIVTTQKDIDSLNSQSSLQKR